MSETAAAKKKGAVNEESKRSFLSIVLGGLTLLVLALIYFALGQGDMEGIMIPQKQSYYVNVNGEVTPDADLSEFTFSDLHAGDLLIYSTKLQGHVNTPMIRVFLAHSTARVFLEDELIYEYGEPHQHMFGYGYITVPLPSDYEGKTLTVAQTVQENGEIHKIRIPSVCDADRYNDGILGSKRLQLIVDCAVILLSATVIIVGFMSLRRNPEVRNLIWMSIAFIGIGLWDFGIDNLIELFGRNQLALKGYIEYLSLYIAPLFFTMYFADDFYYHYKGKNRMWFPVMISVDVAFPIIAIFLHFTDIIHIPKILVGGHVIIVVTLFYILAMTIVRVIRKEVIHKEMLIGTIVLVVVSMVDFARYLFYKFVNVQASDFESIVLIGLYVFALSVIIDYFNTQQRTMLAEARNEALEKLAYEDIMTGVYNRQKINELEQQIVKEPRPFGIVNFDLNDLKKANDRYGHTEGDRLITDFASLLQSVFGKAGVVARMGGDEFIVVYPDLAAVDHEKLMGRLEEECERINRDRDGVRISYAGGFAGVSQEELEQMRKQGDDEIGRVFREMYKRADQKMYENKALVKAKASEG